VPVIVEATPNPRAMKFTIGRAVGGPSTFTTSSVDDTDVPHWVVVILRLPEVVSLFTTADFITVTGSPQVDWNGVSDDIVEALETEFG
jgi:Scaffold protein Nfu/NifU N terminal